jgi:hypothetical protein
MSGSGQGLPTPRCRTNAAAQEPVSRLPHIAAWTSHDRSARLPVTQFPKPWPNLTSAPVTKVKLTLAAPTLVVAAFREPIASMKAYTVQPGMSRGTQSTVETTDRTAGVWNRPNTLASTAPPAAPITNRPIRTAIVAARVGSPVPSATPSIVVLPLMNET